MATEIRRAHTRFDPDAFEHFRFTARELDERGRVTLSYALDDELSFIEEFELPLGDPARRLDEADRERVDGLLALLHWVAGVSYFKTALPPESQLRDGRATARRRGSCSRRSTREGLAELAYTNGLRGLPRPAFARSRSSVTVIVSPGATTSGCHQAPAAGGADAPLGRVLVPIGGGKDSAVALEIVRRSGCELALFSLGDAPPIARTVAVAGLPRLLATAHARPGPARR